MVCYRHHVPEVEDLGYYCIRYKLEVERMAPEDIEAWIAGLSDVFTTIPALPAFYYRAMQDTLEERTRA